MKEMLLTELKISLALTIFCLVYKLLLGSDTFFVRNRIYFLGVILVSFTAPWLKIITKVYTVVPEFTYNPNNVNIVLPNMPVKETSMWPILTKVALGIYLLGVLFYLIRFIWAYHKVISLILNSEKKKFQELILVITRLSVAPFSLLKWLVVPAHQLDHPDFENIVQHESIHCRQYHSVDLFLAELMVAFQWFNPFAWWLKKSMVENHEFIVDREIVQNGVDSRKYQYLLLHLTSGSNQPAVVNYFNTNLLKKRIRMMNKTKSPIWYGLKNGMVLISMAIVVAVTATFETKVIAQDPKSEPVVIINGKKSDMKTMQTMNPENIQFVNVMKDTSATAKYGHDAKYGAIEITTKDTLISQNPGNKDGVKVIGYGEKGKSFIVIRNVKRDSTDSPENMGEVKVVGYADHHSNPSGNTVIKNGDWSFVSKDPIAFDNKLNFKNKKPLVILDGKKIGHLSADEINSYKAHKVIILEGDKAIEKYGDEAKEGVLLLSTKDDSPFPNGFAFRSSANSSKPLYVVNGKAEPNLDLNTINPNEIDRIEVLKNANAIQKYGEQAKDGVIMITLKGVKSAQPNNTNNSLILVPNPTSDNVEVTLKGSTSPSNLDVKMFDKFGKLVYQDKKTGPTFTISVASLVNGVYVVVVTNGENKFTGNLSVVH